VIVVRFELWPAGSRERAVSLGEMRIANDLSGSPTVGNYEVRISKSAVYSRRPGSSWRDGRIEGFPRRWLGPWDPLLRALKACGLECRR